MNYEDMKRAVDAYFGDMTRPASATREGLERLLQDIESKIDALDEDDMESGADR